MMRFHSAFLWLFAGVATHCATQIGIRVAVLDGHNGKPITNARVTVNAVRHFEMNDVTAAVVGDSYWVRLNQDDTLVLGNVTKSDLSWNEYRLCATEQDARPIYSVAAIMAKGLKAPNNCNKGREFAVNPPPGEIVFFVTRLPFWQRLRLFRD
jgi:hypothetical protein